MSAVKGEGVCLYRADILRTRGRSSSDADVRTFCCKNFGFFEIYGVSVRTRRVGRLSQCERFSDKREGVNFLRFCADVLYGWPFIKINLVSVLGFIRHFSKKNCFFFFRKFFMKNNLIFGY